MLNFIQLRYKMVIKVKQADVILFLVSSGLKMLFVARFENLRLRPGKHYFRKIFEMRKRHCAEPMRQKSRRSIILTTRRESLRSASNFMRSRKFTTRRVILYSNNVYPQAVKRIRDENGSLLNHARELFAAIIRRRPNADFSTGYPAATLCVNNS